MAENWWDADKPAAAKAGEQWWEADKPPPREDNAGEGVARQFVHAAPEALLSLPGIPGDLTWLALNKLGKWTGLAEEQPFENNPLGSATIRGMLHDKDFAGGAFYLPEAPAPKNAPERYAKRVGQFVGSAAPFGGLLSAASGGVGSQAAEDLFPESSLAPVVGGLLGSVAPSLVQAGGRAMIPNTTPERARLAQGLLDQDVPVFPGQLADSKMTQGTYSLAKRLSLFTDRAAERQQTALNRASGRLFGVADDTLTPGAIDQARNTLGTEIGQIAQSADIPLTPTARAHLESALPPARTVTAEHYRVMRGNLDEILDDVAANNNVMPGSKFHDYTKYNSPLRVMERGRDDALANFARTVRTRLNDLWESNATPDNVQRFRDVKGQFARLEQVAPSVTASGNVPAGRLLSSVSRGDKRFTSRTGGNLEALARGSKELLPATPSSNTGENLFRVGQGGLGLGAVMGDPVSQVGLAASVLVPPAIKRVLESPSLTRMMIQKSLARAARNATPAQRRAMQGLLTIGQTTAPGIAGTAGLLGRQNVPAQNLGLLQP